MSPAEYVLAIHYLVRDFKSALRSFRHEHLIPEVVDAVFNPVLREIPGAHERVLTPPEVEAVGALLNIPAEEEVHKGPGKTIVAWVTIPRSVIDLATCYRINASRRGGNRLCMEALGHALERAGGLPLGVDKAGLHQTLLDFGKRLEELPADELQHRNEDLVSRWPNFPDDTSQAVRHDDMGECSCKPRRRRRGGSVFDDDDPITKLRTRDAGERMIEAYRWHQEAVRRREAGSEEIGELDSWVAAEMRLRGYDPAARVRNWVRRVRADIKRFVVGTRVKDHV